MRAKKILSYVFYTACILMISILIFLGVSPSINLTYTVTVIMSAIAIILLIFANIIRFSYVTEINERVKTVRISVWILFVFYSAFLLILLFLSFRAIRSHISYAEYFRTNTNFIPFKEVLDLYENFIQGNFSYAMWMLLGNLFAFAPMAFFIPVLFKKITNLKRFAVLLLSMITGVEILQFITRRGSFDIDDIILNFLGVIAAYIFMQTKYINNILNRLYITTDLSEQFKSDSVKRREYI